MGVSDISIALFFVRSGMIDLTYKYSGQHGHAGLWWSSRGYVDARNVYMLWVSSERAYPYATNNSRHYGLSLRCLSR